jgi:hypothetical protein
LRICCRAEVIDAHVELSWLRGNALSACRMALWRERDDSHVAGIIGLRKAP